MLIPYLRYCRLHEFLVGIHIAAGQNQWRPWFCELCVFAGYWEIAVGLRYRKVF